MSLSPEQKSEARTFMRQLEVANVVIAALGTAIAHLATGSGPMARGVLVGGALCVLNLRAMVWLGGKVLYAPKRTRKFYAALFAGKLAILGLLVWASLAFLPVQPFGFMLGFSTLLPALLITNVRKSLEPAAPASGPTPRQPHSGGPQ